MHDHLTWTGLVYGGVFTLMLIGLLLMWAWPRNEKGKLMDPDEVQEFLDKLPNPPSLGASDRTKMIVLAIMIFIVSLGIALVGKGGKHDFDHHND